jgi:hypothetical protein
MGRMIANGARCPQKIKSRMAMAKSNILQEEEDSCHQLIVLKFKEVTSKLLHLELSFVWC